jgi:cobalt-zinc-cadmium efflux system protein
MHAHRHDHRHQDHHAAQAAGRLFGIGLALNLAYVGAEATFGLLAGSLALLADAAHNLGDVLGLGMAWLAQGLARRAPSGRYTYGLRSSSILAALGNTAILLLVTGGIGWEAIGRLMHPRPTGGLAVIAVAAAGVLVNGIVAALFASRRRADLNLRSAFVHMAADALIAVGVVAAGTLILVTGATWIDPAVSLVISAVIVISTWGLLREALDLALQAVPTAVDQVGVQDYLRALPGVSDVHDLHIWGMSTTETALTAHLVRPGAEIDDAFLHDACAELRSRFAIHHATFQVEAGAETHPCEQAKAGAV